MMGLAIVCPICTFCVAPYASRSSHDCYTPYISSHHITQHVHEQLVEILAPVKSSEESRIQEDFLLKDERDEEGLLSNWYLIFNLINNQLRRSPFPHPSSLLLLPISTYPS